MNQRAKLRFEPIADDERSPVAVNPLIDSRGVRILENVRIDGIRVEIKAQGSSSRISRTNVTESPPKLGRSARRLRICARYSSSSGFGAGALGVRLTTGLP